MAEYIKVANKNDIQENSSKMVEQNGKKIALFNLGGEFYAIDDVCSHKQGPLSKGPIEGDEVECPLHGARFKIKTGEAVKSPAREGVMKYNVRVSGEDIEIEIPDSENQ